MSGHEPRLKIKTRLGVGFGILLALTALMGWIGWQSSATVTRQYDLLFHRNVLASVMLFEAERALWELRLGVANYVLFDDAGRAAIHAEESNWFKQLQSNLDDYRALERTPEERQLLKEWDERYARYCQSRARWFEIYRSGRVQEALQWRRNRSNPDAIQAYEVLERLIFHQQGSFTLEEEEIDAQAAKINSAQFGIMLMILFLGALVALYIFRQVTGSARALAQTHASLEAANLELKTHLEAVKAAEAQARYSSAQVQAIIEATHEGILIVDRDGLIQEVNPAVAQILDRAPEEMVGTPFVSYLSPAPSDLKSIKRSFETSAVRAMGQEIPVEITLYRLNLEDNDSYAVFLRNLSESRQLEVEERQNQKLEAIGRLAAGIAHEINTPIQFIGDSAHFLLSANEERQRVISAYQAACSAFKAGSMVSEHLECVKQAEAEAEIEFLEQEIPQALERIREGVARVASIVGAMKEFAYPEQKEMNYADLNRAILNTLTVARNELKYAADIETDFGELPPVMCHVGDFNQVVLNLLVNAAHAIEDQNKGTNMRGTITVKTVCELDMALVSIQDTGCGIPKEIQHKIFDPFFTSKEVGRGSGQGLAISRAVIERHGGKLSFESEVGKGTTFTIRLPIEQKVRIA